MKNTRVLSTCTLAWWCTTWAATLHSGWDPPLREVIEEDLAKVRDRCAWGKDAGGVHSYAMLVANYGGITAVPTDPPYCLVYPTMYNDGMEDQTHFNTVASSPGMHTHVCMCCSLLQFTDKDPKNKRTFEGSHLIIPCGAQYQNLFPEITAPCNHWGPLIDPNIGEPYPMAAVGDFCPKDAFFPGSPGDSLLFNKEGLTRLKRRGFHISTYKEEKPPPTTATEDKCQSSHIQENVQSPSSKEGESPKMSSRALGASSLWVPDSTSSKKSSCQAKCSPQAKEQPDKCDTEEHSASSKHKDTSHSDKGNRRSSNKESSSTARKCGLSPTLCASSVECPWKGPCMNESSCALG